MQKPKQFKPNHGGVGPKFNGRSAIDAMYDSVWTKYSQAFLAINKNCYSCGERSEATDHLIPHHGDKYLFEKTDNHIPLCHRCHNTITSLFDRRHRPGTTIDPKLKWMALNRSRNMVEGRVKVLPRYG